MLRECVISSVLSCHNKNLKWQTSVKPSYRPRHRSWTDTVTAQFYFENKGKYILEAWWHADPKDTKRIEREGGRGEREREGGRQGERTHVRARPPWLFGFSFYMFYLLPLGLPYVNWASQECCLYHPRSSLVLRPPFVLVFQAFPFLVF